MPYESKITTEEEQAQFEQAKKQHYLIDAAGRFTTSPAGLDYLHWSEQENLPYIIVRRRSNWCDVYIDLPGKYKFTEAGYYLMQTLFTEERARITNKNCAYRLTADNAQFEGLPLSNLATFIRRAFAIADDGRSLQAIDRKILRKMQRQNCVPREGDYW